MLQWLMALQERNVLPYLQVPAKRKHKELHEQVSSNSKAISRDQNRNRKKTINLSKKNISLPNSVGRKPRFLEEVANEAKSLF